MGPQAKFGHVGVADEQGSGPAKPGGQFIIGLLEVVRETFEPPGCSKAFHCHGVFECHRQAV